MRGVARTHPLAVVGAVVLAAAAAALVMVWRSDAVAREPGHTARHRLPRTDATVSIGPGTYGRPVRPGFLGFSFEFWALESYAGTDPAHLDPTFVQLVRNLTGGHRTVLRIGGVSTDRVWWPVAGASRPPSAYYTITPRRLRVMKAVAQATNARLILGVQFEANSRIEAAAESRAMLGTIGRRLIEGFELGNEPELYANRWFYQVNGVDVYGRGPGWDFQTYLHDYKYIASAMGHVPIAGPAVGVYSWIAHLQQFMRTVHPAVVTVHRYPLQSCSAVPGSFNYPTISHLLGTTASAGLAEGLAPYVAIVHADHLQLRNAEMNSVSCGSHNQAAETFASALWAADTLFNLVKVGVDGVNIHTFNQANDQLFDTTPGRSGWHAYVAPEYYGVWLFSQAAPPGSRLLKVSASGSTGALRVWATKARDGRIRVVLINDSLSRSETVAVRGPGKTATLERLRAPSARATSGVSLGGRSFGSNTTTGLPRGRLRVTKLTSTAGAYIVRVPATSAALITLG
jgi:Glycosyl hydrolase family 79 C-terminal beta domain